MSVGPVWDVLRKELDALREQYVAEGRAEEFDQYVATLKASGRWPFEE